LPDGVRDLLLRLRVDVRKQALGLLPRLFHLARLPSSGMYNKRMSASMYNIRNKRNSVPPDPSALLHAGRRLGWGGGLVQHTS
jgi:hypothetical protein